MDFKQSLECFISFFNIKFSFENLFKDIFFNLLFHNKIIGFLFIQGFIHSDSDIKKILKNILNLISDIKTPFCKNVGKILGVDNLMEIKCDLTTKILEQIEQLPICVGVGKCEIKNDEDNGEILRKKEIIYIRGKIGRKNNSEDKFDFSEKFPHLNMEKIFMDLNDDDNSSRTIIREKIIINKINKKERNDDNDVQEEKEKSYNKKENITNTNNDNNNSKNDEENNKVSINNNKNDTKSNTNREEEKIKDNKEKDKENFDNKSIEEIYEYINKDSKNKNKKKNKKRNKGRGKKNKNKNVNNNSESNDAEDPLVIQFKNDLSEELIFANSITKIKPYISENWIKTICA